MYRVDWRMKGNCADWNKWNALQFYGYSVSGKMSTRGLFVLIVSYSDDCCLQCNIFCRSIFCSGTNSVALNVLVALPALLPVVFLVN